MSAGDGPALGDRADRLAGALTRMADELAGAKKANRVNRILIAAVAVLAIALAAAVYFTASASSEASADRATAAAARAQAAVAKQEAAAAAQQARDLCLSGNVARAQSAEPWHYVLSIAPPARTAADRRERAKFRAHLALITAARDCAHINPRHP